jgi:hypothetical protein
LVALPEVEAEPSVVTAADPSQEVAELLLVALLPQVAWVEAGALEARSSLSNPRIFLLFLALAEPQEALQSVLEQGELLTAQVVTQ